MNDNYNERRTVYFEPNTVLLHVKYQPSQFPSRGDGEVVSQLIKGLQSNLLLQAKPTRGTEQLPVVELINNALHSRGIDTSAVILYPPPKTSKNVQRSAELPGSSYAVIPVDIGVDKNLDDKALYAHQVSLAAQLVELTKKIQDKVPQYPGSAKSDSDPKYRDASLQAGPEILCFSLNWYLAAHPSQIPTGGPGGQPMAYTGITPPPVTFSFKNNVSLPKLSQPADSTNTQAVQVIILDTIPPTNSIVKAHKEKEAEQQTLGQPQTSASTGVGSQSGDNSFNDLVSDAASVPDGDYETVDNGKIKRWHLSTGRRGTWLPPEVDDGPVMGIFNPCQEYDMSAHGMFVASIIHTIAPDARLHLVEVLNKNGVGTALSMLRALDLALGMQEPNKPILINCSLGFQIPRPGDPLPEDFFSQIGQLLWDEYVTLTQTACEDYFGLIRSQFTGDVAPLTIPSESVPQIVIAAAGNDYHNLCDNNANAASRPLPEFPALSHYAIGVGALDTNDNPTTYTNVSDQPPSDGLQVLGGEVTVDAATGEFVSSSGIISMYIGDLPNGASAPGHWAQWSGTSFSTAIVTGIVANTLAHGGTLQDVFNAAGPNRTLLVQQP